MLTMGLATTLIGALPSYASAGVFAPWALAALRFVQGVGLGGEWGGAALIAVENAPEGKRAWYGMFPQLGPPIGFLIATGLFLLLLVGFGEAAFVDWAWRVPFLLSAVLVAIGLYVRVSLEETPAFKSRGRSRSSSATRSSISRPSTRWVTACGCLGFRAFTFSACCAAPLSSWRLRRRSPPLLPIVLAEGRCCSFPR
jgi:MFS family permease